MKTFLSVIGLLAICITTSVADLELADQLKPYEQFSPYKWTKWIELRPPAKHHPIAAAAVAYAPEDSPAQYVPVEHVAPSDDDDDDTDADDFEGLGGVNAFENWFKRAILPEPPPTLISKKSKDKKAKEAKDATTKKPLVDVPLDFWGPPPSIAPNVTIPPPPGYWAAKKSLFVSKLFAALASSVLNSTGAPESAEVVTTTVSPRQALLDELSEVLLSDVARSIPAEDTTTEPEQFDDSAESDEDESPESSEVATKAPVETPTTINPFLLSQINFLAKLTDALAVQSQPTTTTLKPTTVKPTTTTTAKPKAKDAKKATKKSAAKKSSKKLAKTPSYMKWIPTTTTTPTPPVPAEVAKETAPQIDYNALAKALLGN